MDRLYTLYMKASTEYNITEARRLLPSLVHDLERHPDRVYRIRSRERLVAELRAPAMVRKGGVAARRLLALARQAGRPGKAPKARVSEDTDRYLY